MKYIYNLFNKPDAVENVHLPNDLHGYDDNKRKAAYPFLAKHLGLDITKAMNQDGTLKEDMIVIENQKHCIPLTASIHFQRTLLEINNNVVWK